MKARLVPSALLLALACQSAKAELIERPTNYGIGADAEVRDWDFNNTLGFASELAVRIIDSQPTGAPQQGDRNDLMYIRIDLEDITLADVPGAIFRLSYGKDNQLTQNRVVDPGSGVRAGLNVWGLDPADPGNSWDEATINYLTAPGIDFDFELGESDIDPTKTSFLGNIDFPDIPPQNWFPVGGNLDLSGPALEGFLADAIGAGAPSVTLIAGMQQDGDPLVSGASITNRTYLFVHKGITTLNDPAYDADINDPNNPTGGPFHMASNANGEFSPRLVFNEIPEPTTGLLVALAAAALMARRRC